MASGVVMILTPTQHTNNLPPQIQQILELLLKFLLVLMDLCNLSKHPRYVDEQELEEFQVY